MIKVFLQQEISDCGICCLETIINYYNGYVPLENLRIETNTKEFGTSAYNLIECAKKYGFNAKGIKVKEIKNIKLPAIAHIKINNLYHFIVIYKIKNNSIYIVDPAIGKVKKNLMSFNEQFTGVILEFVPYTRIPKLNKNKFLNKVLVNELKQNKKQFVKILIFSFLILLFTILISLEIKLLTKTKWYLFIFLIIIIINELLIIIKNKTTLLIKTKINNNLILKFISHIFKLPSNYLTLKNNGEMITRFNELNELSNNFITILMSTMFNIALIILLLIVLTIINRLIGLFLILFTTIIIIINYYLHKKIYPYIINSIKTEESYKNTILDYINKIDTIKNLKPHNYFISKVSSNNSQKNQKTYNLDMKIIKLSSVKSLLLNVFNLMFIFIIIYNTNIKESLLLIILFNYLVSIMESIISFFPNYFYIKSIFYKTSEFLSMKPIIKKEIKNFKKITLLNFECNLNNTPLLTKMNLKINNKDKILIKGKSGIGKSTLVRTLSKINDEYKGSIFIDENNLKDINIDSLISYTSQNDSLFYDTIRNNILLDRKIDENLLNDILKITRINEIRIVKEIGLNSLILNNTFNISGGEKNRIILARSLLSNNKIIILDEVLSQVDYNLEINILNDVLNYFKNKTIIYISHRNVSKLFNKVIDLNERSINGTN